LAGYTSGSSWSFLYFSSFLQVFALPSDFGTELQEVENPMLPSALTHSDFLKSDILKDEGALRTDLREEHTWIQNTENFTPEHATKAQRGSRDIALLFL
jgi:hypothetical protein